jgi:hypothetical protein
MGRFSNDEEIAAARIANAEAEAKRKREADAERHAVADADEKLRVVRRTDLADFHAAAQRHQVPTRAFMRQGLTRDGYRLAGAEKTYFLDAEELTLFELRGSHNEGRIVDLSTFRDTEWDALMLDAMAFLRGDRPPLDSR